MSVAEQRLEPYFLFLLIPIAHFESAAMDDVQLIYGVVCCTLSFHCNNLNKVAAGCRRDHKGAKNFWQMTVANNNLLAVGYISLFYVYIYVNKICLYVYTAHEDSKCSPIFGVVTLVCLHGVSVLSIVI